MRESVYLASFLRLTSTYFLDVLSLDGVAFEWLRCLAPPRRYRRPAVRCALGAPRAPRRGTRFRRDAGAAAARYRRDRRQRRAAHAVRLQPHPRLRRRVRSYPWHCARFGRRPDQGAVRAGTAPTGGACHGHRRVPVSAAQARFGGRDADHRPSWARPNHRPHRRDAVFHGVGRRHQARHLPAAAGDLRSEVLKAGSRAGGLAGGLVVLLSACPLARLPAQTVDTIVVENHNVFDAGDGPGFVAHLANALHVTTRAAVIRRTLLFDAGDRYDSAR